MDDLAARLVACPEWKPAPGMRVFDFPSLTFGRLVAAAAPWTVYPVCVVWEGGGQSNYDGEPPDLVDAATGGCLLAMLHERGDIVVDSALGWWVGLYERGRESVDAIATGTGASLGEACARALLALWAPS